MEKMNKIPCWVPSFFLLAPLVSLLLMHSDEAQATTTPIIFPVLGATHFSDDFGDPRSGHTHEGNDIFGVKHQLLVAAADGFIRFTPYPEASYGYAVYLEGDDGLTYAYLHVNNDTIGTDDDRGGGMLAYAPDIESPHRVVAGQLIGWMGDSGNAENTSPHLHFEIRKTSDNAPTDPYQKLRAATHIDRSVVPPPLDGELLPFGQFTGGASIAFGNVDAAEGNELVVGEGPGGRPRVKIFRADMTPLIQFYAFPQSYRGGVEVATGDFDGNGIDEIVVAAGSGHSPTVRVFTADGKRIGQFLAFSEKFLGGVRVATADLDGDHIDEIIVGAGPGGDPQVRIFDSHGHRKGQFRAYAENFHKGIFVAASDATATSPATIVTGAGPGSGAHVRVFDPQGIVKGQFFPYGLAFRGGVRVAIGDLVGNDGVPEIITVPAKGGAPAFAVYDMVTGVLVETRTQFEIWWMGGYVPAARDGVFMISSYGSRRTSVRLVAQNTSVVREPHYFLSLPF